jgi:hypothetical protein
MRTGRLAHYPPALKQAHPADHAQELVVVVRRAGETRAAERQRRIVEEDRIGAEIDRQQRAVGEEIARRHPPGVGARHLEMRVVHPERVEQALAQEAVERLARDHLDHPPHQVEPHRIGPPRARLVDQRKLRHPVGEGVESLDRHPAESGQRLQPGDEARDHPALAEALGDRARLDDAVAEPRGVRDQLADGDRADRRLEVVGRDRAVVDLLHLHVGELRQDLGERLVERELAVVDQHHRRHAGDRLGHRIDAVDALGVGLARAGEAVDPGGDDLGLACPRPSATTMPETLRAST